MLKALVQPVTPFQQNASLIYCDETMKCAIVDPGGDIEILLNISKENNLIPEKILLTHGHIDHAGGATEISKILKIKYYYFEMTTFKELNELYNILDLYIVASRVEGGPQAIFECAITKTPIISTDVGIAKEILATESLYVFSLSLDPKPNTVVAYSNIKKYTIPNWFKSFHDMFESLM